MKPHLPIIVLFFALLTVTACNTGIESTKKIKISKSEESRMNTAAESLLADSITPVPVAEWCMGKKFIVLDNRMEYLVEHDRSHVGYMGNGEAIDQGDVLEFAGIVETKASDGSTGIKLKFETTKGTCLYNTGKTDAQEAGKISLADIPLLADLDATSNISNLLKGRRFWILTDYWDVPDGSFERGVKYVPVTIENVVTGNIVHPLQVMFCDENGTRGSVMIDYTPKKSVLSARQFDRVFSFSDPKTKYSSISPEKWEAICHGKVMRGMTKEECKLAFGSPGDVLAGHTWNTLLDLWTYPDGRFLKFEDGLLVDFRQ